MMSPDHPLASNPTFNTQMILISNLFTGEANRPLQLGDMIKVAKNLNIELNIADLMNKFDAGPSSSSTPPLLLFQDSHAILLILRKPIIVADHYNPSTNTYPPDWYISDQSEDYHKTEYFIQPFEQPLAPNSTMTPRLTVSGAL